jgi:hypothetical protein
MFDKSQHPENPNLMSFGNDNVNFSQNQPQINGKIALTIPNLYTNNVSNPSNMVTPMPNLRDNYSPVNFPMGNAMQNIQISIRIINIM